MKSRALVHRKFEDRLRASHPLGSPLPQGVPVPAMAGRMPAAVENSRVADRRTGAEVSAAAVTARK